jgi:hypothetical protein
MSDAANVHWIPEAAMMLARPGQRIVQGNERKFESVENALRFVMETLPVGVRSTATIQADGAIVQFEDIERTYKGLKKHLQPDRGLARATDATSLNVPAENLVSRPSDFPRSLCPCWGPRHT